MRCLTGGRTSAAQRFLVPWRDSLTHHLTSSFIHHTLAGFILHGVLRQKWNWSLQTMNLLSHLSSVMQCMYISNNLFAESSEQCYTVYVHVHLK